LHASQTRLTCISDMSHTRFGRVPHTFWTRPCLAIKGMAIMYISLQLYREVLRLHGCILSLFRMHLVRIPDASCMHFRLVSHAFQTRLNVTLEQSCTVLFFEKSLNKALSLLFIFVCLSLATFKAIRQGSVQSYEAAFQTKSPLGRSF